MALRVLIAEDEALVAMSLEDLLDADGHEVHTAPNGAAALSAARSLGGLLDVLVTDLNMPLLSGEALIHDLRIERPDLPVVVVSGRRHRAERRNCARVAAATARSSCWTNPWTTKPY